MENSLPERHAAVSLLELHLVRKWKSHGFSTHVEHSLDFFVDTMVFQAKDTSLVYAPIYWGKNNDLLPEA